MSPAELEAVILLHPAVKDTGVVGMPDPSAGELPTAFVVKKPSSNISDKELMEFVATKVGRIHVLHNCHNILMFFILIIVCVYVGVTLWNL